MIATHEADARTPAKSDAVSSLLHGLIRYESLCDLLGMSRVTLNKLANDPSTGFPGKIKLGRKTYVDQLAVRRWIAGRVSAATEAA